MWGLGAGRPGFRAGPPGIPVVLSFLLGLCFIICEKGVLKALLPFGDYVACAWHSQDARHSEHTTSAVETVLQWGQSPFRGKRVELGSGRSGTVYPSWVFICCVTLSLGALLPG